jgi:hypothetical protein
LPSGWEVGRRGLLQSTTVSKKEAPTREIRLKEASLVVWTRDERLTFDIAFALKKVTIPGFRKELKEEDRIAIAQTILEHLKLCDWEFSKP